MLGELSTSMIIPEPYQRCSCSLYRHYATSQDVCIASIRNLEEILIEVSKKQTTISSGIEVVIENHCGTNPSKISEGRFPERVTRRDVDHSFGGQRGKPYESEINQNEFSRARNASIFEMQIKRLNVVLGNQVTRLIQAQKSTAAYDSELQKLAEKRERQFQEYLQLLNRFKQMERQLEEKDEVLREKQIAEEAFRQTINELATENRVLSEMKQTLELQRTNKSWLTLQECQVSLNELRIINGNLKSSLKSHEDELDSLKVELNSIHKQNALLKECVVNDRRNQLSLKADIFQKEISRLNRELANQIKLYIEVKQSLESQSAQTIEISSQVVSLKLRVEQFDKLNKQLIQSKSSNEILMNQVSCLRDRLINEQEQVSNQILRIKNIGLIPCQATKENQEPQNTESSIPAIDRKGEINLLRQRCADYELKMTRLRKEFEKVQRRLRDYQEENVKLQKYKYDYLDRMVEA